SAVGQQQGSGRAAGPGGPFELRAFLDSVLSYGAGPPEKIPEHAGKFFLGGGCISLNRVTIHPLRLCVNIDTRAAAKHAEKIFTAGVAYGDPELPKRTQANGKHRA
ncbi:MAG: hypothetical protein IKC53_09395, partial [Lentisphaeria bacterium]|nr:hypothetical protein [Lentisphaeria bacterium]